jgi:FkbM family methyltransferase
VSWEARRVAQTPKAFANWPTLLSGLLRERLHAGAPGTLTFEVRTGRTITIPNAPGARVPPYEVFADDSYEIEWFLGDLVDQPIHVLDIGAHVGTFACRLTLEHPAATVDCFEPSPDTVTYLRRNVADNDLEDRVTVHEAAVAGITGTLRFQLEGSGSGHNHRAFGDAEDAIEVAAISLDEAVARTGAVHFVKMDCEGGEYDLVYNSSPDVWATVQRLVLEFHPIAGESWEELRDWFGARGLHVVRQDASTNTPGLGVAWLSRTPLPDPVPGPGRSKLGSVAYNLRRVAQTPRTFDNWPALLSGLALEKVGRGPEELTFVTRDGVRLSSANVPGARLPAYEQFAEDGYDLVRFLGDLRHEAFHAVDVGAHVGAFTLHLTAVAPKATVTCYEPAASTSQYLHRNIEQNAVADRVEVELAALTGTSGWATFEEAGPASVHSGLVHLEGGEPGTRSSSEVRTLTWAEVVAAAPTPVVFVKLDCEGGEYQLAYRSDPAEWTTVQRVVLEYHDADGESWADLRAWFAAIGLHLVRQQPGERANLGLAWLSR